MLLLLLPGGCGAFAPMGSVRPFAATSPGRAPVVPFATPPAGRPARRPALAALFAVNGEDAAAVVVPSPPALPKGASDDEVTAFIGAASERDSLYFVDTVIIGAGPAGIGVAHALLRGGLSPDRMLLIDKGRSPGASFREWHDTTKFISPSWAGYPFGVQDLNAVVPDTTVAAGEGAGTQHPTGSEYASYLERMMENTGLTCLFGEEIFSIERRATQGCFLIQSRNDRKKGDLVFIANYVVWAGGEWNSPRVLGGPTFSRDACVHYKHANVEALLDSRRGDDDPIVLVGGGEAGADLGAALANGGAKVIIVEESRDDGEQLDPSRGLSPVTRERLANAGDAISFRTGTKCTGVERRGDAVAITLDCGLSSEDTRAAFPKPTTETIETGADAVLCTGFDPSGNPLLKDLFEWNGEGLPVVTPENDESTVTKNLFLAGPSLMHRLTCKDDEEDDGEDDSKNIIFCFVYKYRTRFGVVASAILQRYMEDQTLKLQTFLETPVAEMDDNVKADLLSPEQINDIMKKKKGMQAYYRSKGFLLTDLSCAQLACGMTGNDAPTYDYESSCACGEEVECETC